MPMIRALVLISFLAGSIACGDDTPTAPTETPTRTQTTETFSGTLNVNGAATHSFSATGSGEIRVTLTELTPDSAAVIGVSLGTWNALANTCQIVLANDSATQSAVVVGNAGQAGSFCARVYDVGRLSGATGYSLTVLHY